MSHITTQALIYSNRSDDIATVTEILDLMRLKEFDIASRKLVIYLDYLQEIEKPQIVDYHPNLERRV